MAFGYGNLPEEGLLFIEIESPHRIRHGERSDVIKLANAMKDAVDKMVRGGMDDISIPVLGVLCEGKQEHTPCYIVCFYNCEYSFLMYGADSRPSVSRSIQADSSKHVLHTPRI